VEYWGLLKTRKTLRPVQPAARMLVLEPRIFSPFKPLISGGGLEGGKNSRRTWSKLIRHNTPILQYSVFLSSSLEIRNKR
jgi:hypothetical protein